jgi:hypothetical protein
LNLDQSTDNQPEGANDGFGRVGAPPETVNAINKRRLRWVKDPK